METLSFLIMLFLLLFLPSLSQVAPTWITSSYVQAQKLKFINGDTCNCATLSGSPVMVTITFTSAFSDPPNLGYAISSLQSNYNFQLGYGKLLELQFDITRAVLTSSTFKFKYQIFNNTKIWKFQLRYIAISRTFPHHLNSFESVPVNYDSTLVNITVESTANQIFQKIVNYTQQADAIVSPYNIFSNPLTNNKIVLFISSLYFSHADPTTEADAEGRSQDDKDYLDLKISATPLSNSTYRFYVFLGLKVIITKLHFSMIVYDEADVNKFGNYTFIYTRIQFGPAGGSYNFPQQFLTNFIAGLLELTTNSTHRSLQFTIQLGTVSGVHGLTMLPSNPKQLLLTASRFNFTTLYLKSWTCPSNFLFDPSTNMCVSCALANCLTCLTISRCSVCNSITNLNSATGVCQIPCSLQGCLTCMSSTVCSICNQAGGYFLDSSTNQCILSPCLMTGCLNCPNQTICMNCNQNMNYILLSNQTCFLCDQNISLYANPTTQTCDTCSLNECIVCQTMTKCKECNSSNSFYLSLGLCVYCDPSANTFINPVTLNCQLCSMSNCLICNSSTECSLCQIGYILSPQNYTCISTGLKIQQGCGDFVKISSEECDDGNFLNNDGCSASCTIQPDFVCDISNINPLGSACFYIGQIWIKVVYIEKINQLNKVQVLLQYFPKYLFFWEQVDFTKIVEVQSLIPISGVQVTKNRNGTVLLSFYYGQDIQNQTVNLKISPDNSGISTLDRIIPFTFSFKVEPTDNQDAYYYDVSTYRLASIISLLCNIISGISLTFFVIGIISGKMIGVQMMAVIEISFLGLISLIVMNPCFAALCSLKFVNGYNYLGSNPLEDTLSPHQVKGIFMLSRFAENFNFTIALIFIPLLVSLFSLILWKTLFRESLRAEKIFKRSLGQYTLNGLLFSGYVVSVSFVLQVKYGYNNSEGIVGILSLPECIICLLLMILYFFFLIFKPAFFGQFTKQFKAEKLSSKYYCYMLVQRLVVGSSLALMLSVNLEIILPLIIFILTGLYVLIRRPYRKTRNNFRVVANMAISSVVLAIYLAYRLTTVQKRKSQPVFMYLPLLICILLIICVIYNVAFMIYQFYKWLKNRISKKQTQQMMRDQTQQFQKLQKKITEGEEHHNTSPTRFNVPTSPKLPRQIISNTQKIKEEINLSEIKKKIKKQETFSTLFNHTQIVYQQYNHEL